MRRANTCRLSRSPPMFPPEHAQGPLGHLRNRRRPSHLPWLGPKAVREGAAHVPCEQRQQTAGRASPTSRIGPFGPCQARPKQAARVGLPLPHLAGRASALRPLRRLRLGAAGPKAGGASSVGPLAAQALRSSSPTERAGCDLSEEISRVRLSSFRPKPSGARCQSSWPRGAFPPAANRHRHNSHASSASSRSQATRRLRSVRDRSHERHLRRAVPNPSPVYRPEGWPASPPTNRRLE